MLCQPLWRINISMCIITNNYELCSKESETIVMFLMIMTAQHLHMSCYACALPVHRHGVRNGSGVPYAFGLT